MVEIVELDESGFQDYVATGTTLVDFNASWCGPCRMLGEILHSQIAPKVEGVKIASVDIDQNPNLAVLFEVMSVPTLVLFRDGEVVRSTVGMQRPQDIMDFINA
jgi:thioredoxin 1